MDRENVEKPLRNRFGTMVRKYAWLRVKFEFSEIEGV